jgi:hypothetical protein
MKPPSLLRYWPLALVATSLTHARQAAAQFLDPRAQEPQWLKIRVSEVSAGVYAEGRSEETSFRNSDTSVRYDRLFVGPMTGVVLDGSVYHPNLVEFHLNTEGSFGWAHQNASSGSYSKDSQYEYLGRFSGTVDILDSKPLHGSIFGDYDHSFRDYDFFSRLTVDSWRYGSRAVYTHKPWTFNTSYTHREETAYGRAYTYTNVVANVSTNIIHFNGITTLNDDTVAAEARHERARGGSSLNYTFNQYSREDAGRIGEGQDHLFAIGDNETFGSRAQHTLISSANFTHRENNLEPSDEASARTGLNLEHNPNLNSLYDLNYDRFETASFNSDNYYGQGQLRHQLYDSLTSTLLLRGSDNEVHDGGGNGFTRRLGAGFGESYTKRLSSISRLRLSNSLLAEHVDSMGVSSIENEPHSFTTGTGGAPPGNFFLNQANVRSSSLRIYNISRTREYTRGIDYMVFVEGALTRIQRQINAGVPTMDDSVVADYQAEPTPEGNYEALSESVSIRIDFWNNLLGIYSRLNLFANNASKELRVQDLLSFAVGTDLSWRWMRAGAEEEYYDSTFSTYRSTRLFQGVSFNLDGTSSISADVNEAWNRYIDSGRSEQSYSFITRYRNLLTTSMAFNIEGGISRREGDGVEQTLATIRPGIDYSVGRTTLRAEYNYEYELYLRNEERTRHMFLVRMRRVF